MKQDGDRLLQLLILNEEFLLSGSHQLGLITSLPFVLYSFNPLVMFIAIITAFEEP